MRKLDLTGQRFGRLVVIKEAGRSSDGRVRWLCKCVAEIIRPLQALRHCEMGPAEAWMRKKKTD